MGNSTILEPKKHVPVIYEADICVLGGSCTGVFAAVRAARLGAKVVIVEKQNSFGGVATSAMVNIWHSLYNTTFDKQIIAGLTQETIERLDTRGAVEEEKKNHSVGYILNTEELKIELDELIVESEIKAYLHTSYVAPYVKDGNLSAIIVENKSGRGAIRAKIFIDATGDGDLCAHLDLPFTLPKSLQPPTTCAKFRRWSPHYDYSSPDSKHKLLNQFNMDHAMIEHAEEFQLPEGFGWGRSVPGAPEIFMYAGTRAYHTNSVDGDSLTLGEIEGRRQVRAIMDMIRKYSPQDQITLVSLPSNIGIRDSRHIQCRYQLTGEDVLTGRRFNDAIANGSYRVDIHHDDKPGLTFKYLNGEEIYIRPGYPAEKKKWREDLVEDPTFYQIPYRSMIPGQYNNLIACGRMIDADREAYGAIRVMVNMNQTGEAAGVAAYLALHSSTSVDDVDTDVLRETLKAGGSIII